MPEYLSPGVYVEEIDAGPKPIEGVSTSTAGAVGITERGPSEGKPMLVTSFADFVRRFGGPLPEPDPGLQVSWKGKTTGGEWWRFALAAKGFFDNGGQRMFVKRVVAKTAVEASADLKQGLYLDIDKPAKAADKTLALSRTSGLTGIAKNTVVRLTRVDGSAEIPLTVDKYDGAASTVTFTGALTRDVLPDLWVLGVELGGNVFTNAASLSFQAYGKGEWGNKIRARMRPMVSGTLGILPNPSISGNSAAQTTLTVKTSAAGSKIEVASLAGFAANDSVLLDQARNRIASFVSTCALAAPVGAAVAANDPVAIAAGTAVATLTAPAAGNQITVQQANALSVNDEIVIGTVKFTVTAQAAPNTYTLGANPAGTAANDPVYRVKASSQANAAAVATDTALEVKGNVPAANDKLLVGAALLTVTSVRSTADLAQPTPVELPIGTVVRRLLSAINAASATVVYLSNASRLYENALLEFDNGTEKETALVKARVGSRVELFGAGLAKAYFDTDSARLIEGRLQVSYQRDPADPPVTETFEALRLKDDASPQYVVSRLGEESALVRVKLPVDATWNGAQPDLKGFPSVQFGGWATLSSGDDKYAELKPDDFIGEDKGPGKRSGITALEDIDEISICLAPGIWADDVRKALIEHCELLKDRFAVVDPTPAEVLPDAERIDPETIKAKIDSKYGAVYYPWLFGRDFVARKNVRLPPSGHIAGIYARSDVERGVHKAPANEVVRGIERFEIDIAKREQDLLNPKGVNALRYFPGRGFRVWGARTLTSDSSWKYVNVRRLFIFVEESIDEGTQWVVFEPNDDRLWARVRQTINQFLDRLWREGMLQGATRDEAYFVKCDRTTMTQDEIDNGRLICIIGIAPVKPAEFVIFRIQQKTLDQRA